MNQNYSTEAYIKAKKKVIMIKDLIKHFIAFIMINILLIGLNLLTNPQNLWFYYITIIWILILIGHYFYVYDVDSLIFNKNWEQRRLEKEIRKELK